ncbi:hypothetical protein I3500192B8_09210 [Acidaminococcus intestini]
MITIKMDTSKEMTFAKTEYEIFLIIVDLLISIKAIPIKYMLYRLHTHKKGYA